MIEAPPAPAGIDLIDDRLANIRSRLRRNARYFATLTTLVDVAVVVELGGVI